MMQRDYFKIGGTVKFTAPANQSANTADTHRIAIIEKRVRNLLSNPALYTDMLLSAVAEALFIRRLDVYRLTPATFSYLHHDKCNGAGCIDCFCTGLQEFDK